MIGMDEIWMQKRLTTASATATAIPGELRISDQTYVTVYASCCSDASVGINTHIMATAALENSVVQ
jgi:hypothetical protein